MTRHTESDLGLNDPFAKTRALFDLPPGVTYLAGNSLGALPHSAREAVERAVRDEWGVGLIRSWNSAGWIDLSQQIGAKLESLLGAPPSSIVACDGTSVNLYKVMHAACALRPERKVLITDIDNFPSDLYVIDSVAKELGLEVRAVHRDEVAAAITNEVAVVELTQVDYRSAAKYDMDEITSLAHAKGALTVWDLAHSAGAVPVDLAKAEADFMIGCGYKYLNGGPGAPAFIYVAPQFANSIKQPLHGWFGHARPFEFERDYEPAAGIKAMLVGTPSILAMTALCAALDAFDGVSMSDLWQRSLALTSLFFDLADEQLAPRGFDVISERSEARGSHVALSHQGGYAIVRALIDRGIIGDFRRPNVLRFGFSPLYNTFADVKTLISECVDIVDSRIYLSPEFATESAVI
jgi:kynureninase